MDKIRFYSWMMEFKRGRTNACDELRSDRQDPRYYFGRPKAVGIQYERVSNIFGEGVAFPEFRSSAC